MPQQEDAKKRRRRFFARIIPSLTFTKCLSLGSSIPSDKRQELHSKSTYFYRWGSRKKNYNKLSSLSSSLTYVIPSVCSLALLVGGVMMVNPSIMNNSNKTYAKDYGSEDNTGNTGSADDDAPSIAISFPTTGLPEGFDNSEDQVTTAKAGEVAYRSNIFDVTVNNSNWYAILIRAANGYSSELKNGDARITGVGKNVSPSDFKENTWGYALTKDTTADNSSLFYDSLPENDILESIYTYNSPITSDVKRFKLVFAALFGGDAPSGHYQTQVYLSAIMNPTTLAMSNFGVSTLQEMNDIPTACSRAEIGASAQLRDARDDKLYWVSRLTDGNCWMAQNLDYDVTGIQEIKTLSDWSSGYNFVGYYNPGDYIYHASDDNPGQSSTDCASSTGLSGCTQFVAVSSNSDMHYHVGNYYSWQAAMTGGENSNGAKQGICPTGWQLPTGNSDNGSFQYLLTRYGLQATTNSGSYTIYSNPLYFIYGGYLIPNRVYNAGSNGYYWTSSVQSGSSSASMYSYSLNFSNTIVSALEHNSPNYYGAFVRCLFMAS